MPTLFDSEETIAQNNNYNLLPKDGEALFFPNFFNTVESDHLYISLLENTSWQQDQIGMYGKILNVPRLTAWYGSNNQLYTYSGITMKANFWTNDLLEIKHRIETIAKVNFNAVLLNLYRDGKDSVAWHADDEPELGLHPTIGSVSFGAARMFKFRHIQDKSLVKVELTSGSFLLMQGSTQHNWEHQIPKTSKKISPRINLTFRIIH